MLTEGIYNNVSSLNKIQYIQTSDLDEVTFWPQDAAFPPTLSRPEVDELNSLMATGRMDFLWRSV